MALVLVGVGIDLATSAQVLGSMLNLLGAATLIVGLLIRAGDRRRNEL